MNRKAGFGLFLAMALLFVLANRGAFRGYFQDDELDNLGWAPVISASEFVKGIVTPKFNPDNFRPVPSIYFAVMGRNFGLRFPPYIWPLHLFHLLNAVLIWLIARRLGVTAFGAAAGALFFIFDMAAFDVFWKPMYVFDLLCATLCLASILLYLHRQLVLSFLAFWLAYKSKELAVMLPAVLFSLEWWVGKRRWKPLIPFFLVSLSFGFQAIFLRPHQDNDYTFRFTLAALAKTLPYYAGRIFLVPFAGLAVLALPFMVRDRRVWFGVAGMALFFFPLLFLPGRLFSPYTYVPLAALAIAIAAAADHTPRAAVLALAVVWLGWNEYHLRMERRRTLAIADENRTYITALTDFYRRSPETRLYIYDGHPQEMRQWGIAGAITCLCRCGGVQVMNIDDEHAPEAIHQPSVALLNWNPITRRLSIAGRDPKTPDVAYITMDHATPLWQLERGWQPLQWEFRWTRGTATARLHRPEGAKQFELRVIIAPDQLRDPGHVGVRVLLNGGEIGTADFTKPGWQAVRWDLPPGPAGPVEVDLQVAPVFRPNPQDPRELGVPVGGFGFLPRERS